MPNLASNKSFYIDLILCDIILKTAKINDNSVFLGHGISIIAETFCWEDMKLCRTRLIVIINSMIANSHIKETFICLECIWVLSLIIIMQTLFQLKKRKHKRKFRSSQLIPKSYVHEKLYCVELSFRPFGVKLNNGSEKWHLLTPQLPIAMWV